MVTVTTPSGPQNVDGTGWNVDEGYLTVTDDQDDDVATFAPGAWQQVTQAAVAAAQ